MSTGLGCSRGPILKFLIKKWYEGRILLISLSWLQIFHSKPMDPNNTQCPESIADILLHLTVRTLEP